MLKKLTSLRTDEQFMILEQKASQLSSEIKLRRNRHRTRSCSTDNFETIENKMKKTYFEVLDIVVAEMKARFQENDSILLALLNAYKMELVPLKPLECLTGIELPNEIELQLAKDYLAEREQEPGNIDGERSILQRLYPIRAASKNVYKLFCANETFGCSTAICECSFSALARVGIMERIHMSNERLRSLTFLAFESKQLNNISNEAILRHFNEMKDRRLQIF